MDNVRQLMVDILDHKKVDRLPVVHWWQWDETLVRWKNEGLPKDVEDVCAFFDVPKHAEWVRGNNHLFPLFDEETLEETPEYRLFRQHDGVIAQHWKNKSCIPHFVDFTIKGTDGKGWDEYKKRLQPHPGRIPKNLKEQIKKANESNTLVVVSTGSMIGWIRDWVGVENLAYIAYDNRDLLKEMVKTIADIVIWDLDQICPNVKIDAGWGWEDICFRTGPLISPDIFQECCVPQYRRVSDRLLHYGIKHHIVDCDGLVDDLIPGWLEGGVDTIFPIEIGAWKADPLKYKKKYGNALKIYGGLDKLELEKGRGAIDAEIARRMPLFSGGGVIPLPDHLITPGTSLSDYQYYLEKMRKIRL